MPAVALSRVAARVVESGPDGEDLAAGTSPSGSGSNGLARQTWPGCTTRGTRSPPPPASVRGCRARRTARQAETLARERLRAVAAAGKTSRGAPLARSAAVP